LHGDAHGPDVSIFLWTGSVRTGREDKKYFSWAEEKEDIGRTGSFEIRDGRK